jgi:SAM-dependent methyltransferase
VQPHPNYRYLVREAALLAGPAFRALDFGCGAGDVVAYARGQGIDMVGADVFHGGNDARRRAEASGELGRTLFEMKDGRLPFPAQSFDFACSNQVFEHVADIDLALSEIRRVLRPGGTFLNIFPVETIREGHCGIPLAHWLNGFPAAQRLYLRVWRSAGFGYRREGKSKCEWVDHYAYYLQAFTCYRSRRAVHRAYARHFPALAHAESDFAAYRLELMGWQRCAGLAAARPVRAIVGAAVRRLGSDVLVAQVGG